MASDSILLLGRDYGDYDELHVTPVGSSGAAAISAGADQRSPSLRFKGDMAVPNEDALCVVDVGDWVVVAVADAHFGHESSHVLMERLFTALTSTQSATATELDEIIVGLGDGPDPETKSESTLLVAMIDRECGRGHVVSFGDSTLVVVTATGAHHQVNDKDDRYVAAGRAWPLGTGATSEFVVVPGDTVLAFTDGIDECHYRNPETSVQPEHIADLVRRATGGPAQIANELAAMALNGVGGNPGGQDNIALVVVQA